MSTQALLTVEQFEQLGEERDRCELVEGELVEKPMPTVQHDYLRDILVRLANNYLDQHPIGMAFAERDVRTLSGNVRRPDMAYFKRERLTRGLFHASILPFTPDLVVEVVSPNDKVADLWSKIHEYLEGGTEVVWVIHPETREAEMWVRGSDRNPTGCKILEASCLPGFSIEVASLFQVPGLAD
jgi:Uma2 family endonuclease